MRGETFEQTRERSLAQDAVGLALAQERFERGQFLTDDERSALNRNSMFGSDGYPLTKLGRGWIIDTACYKGPLFKTKRQAWCAWETFVSSLVALSGLEAQKHYTQAKG